MNLYTLDTKSLALELISILNSRATSQAEVLKNPLTHPQPHPSPVETLAVAGEESGLQALGLGWALRGTHSALYPSELQTVKVPN